MSCAPGGWQKQQGVEGYIPMGILSGHTLLPQTHRHDPLHTSAREKAETSGGKEEHSLNLPHLPCPVLLLVAGIQMNKNAFPQA